ncbi:MAG: FumA C-terminus/TtdB family hydratase beta subunit [Nitrospirota bacterium]
MPETIRLETPLDDNIISRLKTGDRVSINGILYIARDMTHKKMVELIRDGVSLPIDLKGHIIYFSTPTPARPNMPIGSTGPTTSSRMDGYSPYLIKMGLKGMIGKGPRSKDVIDIMNKYKCIYFAALGGTGALISQRVKETRVISFMELGIEALRELRVEDFSAIVINDIYGGDLYVEGVKKYCEMNG